ncbi:MAG: hypothetical protein KDA70_14900 [Planctomycetaceae bacterium]|nr:hypothetical protein [Planctomycetaceae bacterium]
MSLFFFACLCLQPGCGTKEEVSTPSVPGEVQSHQANTDRDQAAHHWETPETLLLFVARHQPAEQEYEKDTALYQTAVALVDVEDLTQASQSIQLLRTPELQKKAQKRQITKLLYTDRMNLALELAEKMDSPSERGTALELIAEKLIKEGDVIQARTIALQTTDLNSKAKIIRTIARTLKSPDDIEQALQDSRNQTSIDERDLALCCVVVQLANQNEIPRATELLRELRSEAHQRIAAGALASAQVKAGETGSAMSLLRQGAVDPYDLIRPDITRALLKSNNIDQALEVALEIETLPFQTHAIFYVAVQLMEHNQFQRAQEVILLINKASENEEEEKKRFSTLASFAGRLLDHGKLAQIKVFATQVDIEVFRYYKFFEEMIKTILSQGDLEQALQLTKTFPEDDILAAVSLNLAKQGQFQQAQEIALKIKDSYHRSAALAPLVELLLKADEIEQAFLLLQKMDDTGFQCTGPGSRRFHYSPHHWHYDYYAYEKMIKKLLDADRLEQALEVTQLLNEQKEKAVYTEYLVEQLIEREKYQKAIDISLNFIADTKYQARVLRSTVKALIKAVELQQARKLTQQISIPELKAELHLQLAGKFQEHFDLPASREELLSARNIVNKLEQTRLNTESARMLITALIEAGELPQATRIACRIEEKSEKLPALYELTRELTKGTPLEYRPAPKSLIRDHKLKAAFTPEEQQLARQIVDAINAD